MCLFSKTAPCIPNIYIYDLYFKLYIVGLGKLFGELQFDFVERKFSEETTEGEEEDKDDYL
jgi:hypothetical protein